MDSKCEEILGTSNLSEPLQCSCLENPRDGGAWWTAVYGVSQSQTLLKQLSSSNLSETCSLYFHFYICIKIRLVKAMVFPVVMYGCESWTVKKAEH